MGRKRGKPRRRILPAADPAILSRILPIWHAFASLSLRKHGMAACLRTTRPGMTVFYLGDMRDAGDTAMREIVTGEAALLACPVREPDLAAAADRLEERRSPEPADSGSVDRL